MDVKVGHSVQDTFCTAMAREAPPPGVWGAKSPEHKRPRHKDPFKPPDTAPSTLTTLTPQELTRAVVAHDNALRSLQAQLSLTFKLDPSCPLADALLRAVKSWQAEHKRGHAHPQGSCATAVSLALLEFLANTQDSPLSDEPEALSAVRCVQLLPTQDLCHEFTHASVRMTAKGTHVLLELRPHLQSALLSHLSTIADTIKNLGGEQLAAKPRGAIVRKARE